MTKKEIFNQLLCNGLFLVVRVKDREKLFKAVETVVKAGIKNIEITMTVKNALDRIAELSKMYAGDVIIGAGTITTAKEAEDAINAGAKFIVSPIFSKEVINKCKENDTVIAAGCFSPTEIFTAWNLGADLVKVFPATSLGPKYFKDIKAPMPYLKLMPTGGVSTSNIGEWIKCGADAIAVGTDILKAEFIENDDYEMIYESAKSAVENLNNARYVAIA